MSIENKSIKIGITAAASAILLIISFALAAGRWQEGMERRLLSVEKAIPALEEKAELLGGKVSSQDVRYAEIRADLAWIKTTLVRIEEKRKE